MGRMGRIGLMGLIIALASLAAWAAATTTFTAPPPAGSRSNWATNRYAEPVEGLVCVTVVTDGVTDQTVSVDSSLAGYLERISYDHNGNDASWTLTVADADGVNLFNKTDCAAAAATYIVSVADTASNYYAGVPFAGGLSVSIASADTGTGTAVTIKLYIREAWRR